MTATLIAGGEPAEAFEAESARFVREAHRLVRDLLNPSPARYWTDFLITIATAYSVFAVYLAANDFSIVQIVAFVVCGLAMFRAVVFTHEIAHRSPGSFRVFTIVWNLFCGVLFLMPSFLYGDHKGHHSNHAYGTRSDPEYLLLAAGSRVKACAFLLLALAYPMLTLLRFLLLTPLALSARPVDRFVWARASSLYVMNECYRREYDAAASSASRWLQECGCSVWAWTLVALTVTHHISWSAIGKTYLVFLFWILVNQVRTLAAHRYASELDLPLTYLDQVLDTNTFAEGTWLPELWAPLGMRYHALHHLMPSIPYHAMQQAHNRLIERLPRSSPYHRTIRRGLWPTLRSTVFDRATFPAR